MITREDLRDLSQFRPPREGCLLSFFFQPRTPRNKAHREESIVAKDIVKEAAREIAKNGKDACASADLDRIYQFAEQLHLNGSRAKAVFACGKKNFWREFDLPAQLPSTQLFVNRRFHLKPLMGLLGAQLRLGVVLVDRKRARLFDFQLDELREREGMFHPQPPHGRSDGYAGYEAGHGERRVADEAMHHFKNVAQRLKEQAEHGVWEKLIVGCHHKSWPEFSSHLHPYVQQRIVGHFSADVASVGSEHIRQHANEIQQEWLRQRQESCLRTALSHARSHRRGVTGLRRVLRSLEMGEVQTLVLGPTYSARAVECTNCSHIDSHMVRFCPACGRATQEVEDVSEAIIGIALRRDIEIVYVDDPQLDSVGNIAALLRFRADVNTNRALAAAS